MTLYNFNILVGFQISGVEYAQGYRSKLLNQLDEENYYIFTELPNWEYVRRYSEVVGIPIEQLMSVHISFLEDASLKPSVTLSDIRHRYPHFDQADFHKKEGLHLNFYQQGKQSIAVSFLDEESDIVDYVTLFAEGMLLRKDIYTNRHIYSEYYSPQTIDGQYQAALYRRAFLSPEGNLVYEEVIKEGNSTFVFANHRHYLTKYDLLDAFVKRLDLTEKDWLLLDRSQHFDFAQVVLKNKGKAKVAAIIHSEHYFPRNYDASYLFINYEYYYIIKYAKDIDVFVTSTALQKERLGQLIFEEMAVRPHMAVIPVGSVSVAEYKETNQHTPFSMMTASRFDSRKHIDWLIKAVVLAKKVIPDLIFYIYGEGSLMPKCRELIIDLEARDYILLKGHVPLEEVYPSHELYLTASTWETFGLSILEAVSHGLPIIGLDVPYGNQTFVTSAKNGYLVPFDHEEDESVVIIQLAEAIVTYFNQGEQVRQQFRHQSLEVASRFSEETVLEGWKKLLAGGN
ncbi:glycosyltransferase [Streptococcus halotolerans]|uniref:glycosyltransferase n=1 Tax=Streptococcus halotolerans TaxID=1814128 RepID=UPI000A72573A|nr:glycosyltransferase [Streptococcus halotolerans]